MHEMLHEPRCGALPVEYADMGQLGGQNRHQTFTLVRTLAEHVCMSKLQGTDGGEHSEKGVKRFLECRVYLNAARSSTKDHVLHVESIDLEARQPIVLYR